MEPEERPLIAFGLTYADDLVLCEVYMNENSFDVHFNHHYTATVEMADDMYWILSAGSPLPQDIIDEIGFKIEHYYD